MSQRVRDFTGGRGAFDVEAHNLRRLIDEMDRLYPGLGAHVEENMAVAIDGAIYQDGSGGHLIGPHSEVVLIPKIAGG
jgi:molybdopterin converting factor small subunit